MTKIIYEVVEDQKPRRSQRESAGHRSAHIRRSLYVSNRSTKGRARYTESGGSVNGLSAANSGNGVAEWASAP